MRRVSRSLVFPLYNTCIYYTCINLLNGIGSNVGLNCLFLFHIMNMFTKILKWNFLQLTGEYVEQLTLQMEKNFSKGMMDMMFNVDFKQHIKAIEILIKVHMLYKSRVGKK